jgi:4,5-DOPA dioxygenase extradiol
MAVPTPDHYLPLLYTAAMAAAGGQSQSFIEGYSLGSLSMTSYHVGPPLDLPDVADSAADLPADVPPDQTNM